MQGTHESDTIDDIDPVSKLLGIVKASREDIVSFF